MLQVMALKNAILQADMKIFYPALRNNDIPRLRDNAIALIDTTIQRMKGYQQELIKSNNLFLREVDNLVE
jgi:hypothetical protein